MSRYLDYRQTRLRHVADSRRRRQRAVRTTGTALCVVPLLVGGATTGAADPSDAGWGPARTIQGHTRLDSHGPVFQLPNGSTVALWTNSRGDHLFSAERQAGGAWSEPEELGGPRSRVWSYDAVEDPRNEITLAWRGTIDGHEGIWSRRFVDGAWTERRLEVNTKLPNGDRRISMATARGVTALLWFEFDPEIGEETKVAARRGSDEMTILPSLPPPNRFVYHLAVDTAGRPTVVSARNGQVLVTTYGSDDTWVEEPVGPSPGYELPSVYPRIAATSNRSGDLAVGWRETLPDAGPFDPGTTVVRFRPRAETFRPSHILTTESNCDRPCVTLGVAADGDVTAVYPVWLGDLQADVWITRRDAATETWLAPQLLAHDVNRYAEFTHSTARGGRSVVAIPTESAYLAFRCDSAARCGTPAELDEPERYQDVSADVARGRAALMWGAGCAFECEYETTLRARVYE